MNKIIYLLAFIVFTWGAYIYSMVYGLEFSKATYYTLSLFFANIKTPSELGIETETVKWWQNIFIPGVLALIVLLWAIVSLYIGIVGNKLSRLWQMHFGNRILVIGLGEGNRAYIDSELKVGNTNIIAVEANKNNPYIEHYAKKILVEVADASKKHVLRGLKVQKRKHIIISAGEDIANINIAKAILNEDEDAKLFLHLNDRSLRYYHKENGVLSSNNIRVFSYYEESARELFDNHYIDGSDRDIIDGTNAYALVVVGDNALAQEVIAQACIMGQLPNGNELIIYCMSKETKSFKNSIELSFTNITSIPNVTIKYIDADYKTIDFYKQDIWKKDVKNIVLCYEDDQTNLDIAANLTNLQFLNESVDKVMKCKIHIAMSDSGILSKSIDGNNELFKHIYIFAQTEKVSDRQYIVAANRDALAVSVDYIYENIYPKVLDYESYKYEYYFNEKKLDKSKYIELSDSEWSELSYFRKESNRAVADHIKTKLKYLGLKIVQSGIKNRDILYKKNRDIFDEKISNVTLLAKCEHNRWSTFHYLQGYHSIPFISKHEKKAPEAKHEEKKQHMCLVDFDDFKKKAEELKSLGYDEGSFEAYDVMIVEQIPRIVTYAGYEFVEI